MPFRKKHPRVFKTIITLLLVSVVTGSIILISTVIDNLSALTDPDNTAIKYADGHWNWNWYSSHDHDTVMAGTSQPGFECAEFVARALSTQGIFPGLDPDFPQNQSNGESYGTYRGYHLWNVGVPGIKGLYDYLIDKGYGKDIGNNPANARPGDVVFYYGIGHDTDVRYRVHTAILVQTGKAVNGNGTLIDSHNLALYHFPYNWWEAVSIVHLSVNDHVSAPKNSSSNNTKRLAGYASRSGDELPGEMAYRVKVGSVNGA
jgi:hypothetical protein